MNAVCVAIRTTTNNPPNGAGGMSKSFNHECYARQGHWIIKEGWK